MPRMGRIVIPNYPHHVVQRGHNRQVVFASDDDYRRYISDLKELKDCYEVRVYAYCLMTNHVHLLLAPGDSPAGMGMMMKALAARATRYRNRLEARTGTLWESRYKSSPVQTDEYLLACCRYIELNPLRAGMVRNSADYPWSSYRQRMGKDNHGWIDLAPCYVSLGASEAKRRKQYQAFTKDVISQDEMELIGGAVQRGQLTGNRRFVDEVERIIDRRVEYRAQGRPAKVAGRK